jgi:hypothetical protein
VLLYVLLVDVVWVWMGGRWLIESGLVCSVWNGDFDCIS